MLIITNVERGETNIINGLCRNRERYLPRRNRAWVFGELCKEASPSFWAEARDLIGSGNAVRVGERNQAKRRVDSSGGNHVLSLVTPFQSFHFIFKAEF